MITIEIVDWEGTYIKQWQWLDNMPIPQVGDTLLLHFGDFNEDECKVNVTQRIFSGTRPSVICLVVDFVIGTNGKEPWEE